VSKTKIEDVIKKHINIRDSKPTSPRKQYPDKGIIIKGTV
jgi:hypothetical protein